MPPLEAIDELFTLDTELHALGAFNFNGSAKEYGDGFASSPLFFFEGRLGQTFDMVNNLLNSPLAAVPVSHPLSQRTVDLVEQSNGIPPYSGETIEIACLESEPRLFRSLNYLEGGRRLANHANHRPAAVLFDVAGKPFAFQKASGLKVAYAWDNADFDTRTGVVGIPADSWFMIKYRQGRDPLDRFAGAGLIALRGVEQPLSASFLRFSTRCLGESLRHAALTSAMDAAERRYKLRSSVPEAMTLDPAAIGARVCRLLENREAPFS